MSFARGGRGRVGALGVGLVVMGVLAMGGSWGRSQTRPGENGAAAGGKLSDAQLLSLAAKSERSPGGILRDLRKFQQTGRVLMVAAHPDDENTQLITYLARGRNYRMAYLSITRGDGGQNLLGGEFGDELGLIRTHELLLARQLDGGEQFFTRARDFGFSKSPEETLRIWDKAAVLGDVVRTIRTFQPDVIVTRFSPTGTGTHGHHTASAILALEAFKLAADPSAYPEQLKTLNVWQAKRILQNSGFGGDNGGLRIEIGGNDPELGMSFGEIANRSRGMHKSQGFDRFGGRGGGGPRTEAFTLLAGDPATKDILDGVDTTWKRVPGGEEVAPKIEKVIAAFDEKNPAESLPGLLEIRQIVQKLPPGNVADEKRALLDRIIEHCAGLTISATTPQALVEAGQDIPVKVEMSSKVPVRISRVVVGDAKATGESGMGIGSKSQALKQDINVRVPADMKVSQPYWLSEPPATGIYTVSHPGLIGRPENLPVLTGGVEVVMEGQTIPVMTEVREEASGRRLEVIAPVSLGFPFEVRLFKPGVAREVTVEVTSRCSGAQGTVKMTVPSGWKAEPAEQPFAGGAVGTATKLAFTVTPPAGAGSGEIGAVAEVGGKEYRTGWKEIRYSHLEPLLLQPTAALHGVVVNLATAGKTIGYLPGAGDSVAESLEEMGYAVTILGAGDLEAEKLKTFDAVVVGVRAFNVRPELKTKAQALWDYAAAGGTVVEQYNRPGAAPMAPAELGALEPTNSRVTDETAEMKMLVPGHPAFNFPNKITASDFEGWVQERGIYYPTSWGKQWTPLLASGDPGEKPLEGGLLVAKYGQGTIVYTGLVFFRELPAGVPGAYRLFANLVSLGKQP